MGSSITHPFGIHCTTICVRRTMVHHGTTGADGTARTSRLTISDGCIIIIRRSNHPSSLSPQMTMAKPRLPEVYATALNLPAEDVKDSQVEFLYILQSAGPSQVVLPIHNAILQPAQAIWHAPASCTLMPKCAERQYFVPAKNTDFLFVHPPSNSLVVQVAIQWARQQHRRTTPPNHVTKTLDLIGHKV